MGALSLTDCTLSGNASYRGGGLATSGAATTILTECTVSGNLAAVGGGVASLDGGQATLNGGTVTANDGSAGGGLAALAGGSLTLANVTVSGNSANQFGGGLYNDRGTITLTDCAISGNSAADSAGLDNNYYGTATLTGCTVSDNKAQGDTGGLGNVGNSTMTLANCTVSDNSAASQGGGLYNGSAATLTDCTVSGNSAHDGGGLWNVLGTARATLTNCTVSGNSAARNGGGLYDGAAATATLTNCTVSGNSAARNGGGVYNGNGGVYQDSGATAFLTNCTVSGNSAASHGGGLYNGGGAMATLTNCTISGNTAIGGGGLNNTSTATLTNTIVAGNPAGGDVDGPISGSDNVIGGNPLLAPLGDFGGPTQTMPLLPGSPAIGTGMSTGAPTTDQRGFNRGSTVDIGAFQDQGFTFTPITGSTPQTTLCGAAFTNPLAVTVTANNTSQFVNPVDGGMITFTAPMSGASASLSATAATITGGIAGVTATANATGGEFIITATFGAAQAAFFLKNFSLVVTTTLDETDDTDGLVSLREVITYAQDFPGPHTITFDPAVFGTTPQTITLTRGPLSLTDTATMTISGPGANLLTVSGNNANQVFDIERGSVALSGLTVSGGNAGHGGGLYNNGGTLTLTNCGVSDNVANDGGGLFTQAGGTTTLINCTVSGNSGTGGGLYNSNSFSAGSSTALINCTVSGNIAAGNGGGLYNNSGGTLTLADCSVGGNTAGGNGGGLYISRGATATLTNTIVARNGGGDVLGALDPGSANNLVGIATGMTGISDGSEGNQVGTGPAPLDPLLASLGDYGGSTQTMPLLPGSPAFGGGAAGPGVPATDQRGQPRSGRVDIGAFQSGGFSLTTVAGSTPQRAVVNSSFASPLAVAVTANDPIEPVDGGVIIFAAAPAANGASAAFSANAAVIAGGKAGVTATANGTPGRYIALATAAGDGLATFVLTNTQTLASPRPIPISPSSPIPGPTTTADVLLNVDGLTSLRAAIAYANSHPGPDIITFDPFPSGKAPRTIKLIGGPLVLTDPATVTIIGPGANRLTLSGGGKSRVLDIEGGSLALEGLTITGGRANRGGGILNDGGTLALDHVVLRGNHAHVGGGLFNDGRASLSAVSIKGNRAHVGSGIFNARPATLLWHRSPAAIRKTARLHREGASSVNRITPEHKTAAQIDFSPRAAHAGRG